MVVEGPAPDLSLGKGLEGREKTLSAAGTMASVLDCPANDDDDDDDDDDDRWICVFSLLASNTHIRQMVLLLFLYTLLAAL